MVESTAGQARELPVDAKVFCTDGEVGRLTDVIVNPVKRKVTHIVVRNSAPLGSETLVPAEQITESSREEVHLSCTKDQVAHFPAFKSTRFVPASSPDAQTVITDWDMTMAYDPLGMPYRPAPDDEIAVEEDRVPEGELAFDRGARVESVDGKDLGVVEAFVVHPADETISHFVLRSGLPTRAIEVTLPVSSVASATGYSVGLNLTAEEVERLPAVPARRHYDAATGGTGDFELLALVFASEERAGEALQVAKGTAKSGKLDRLDAAVVRKAKDGRISSREEHDISARRGAVVGAVAGGALSLLAGPVGLAAGLIAGGATGGLMGALDRGVPDRYVRDLGRALQPGTSALVLLNRRSSSSALLEALEPLGGEVLRLALSDEMLAKLTAATDSSERQ